MVVGRAGPSAGDSPVHARALVQGRVWRAGQERIPLTIDQRIRTGRTADQYVLRLARAELRLCRTGRFEAYDSEQFCRTLVSGRDDGSLVEVIRIRRHELHVELIRLSREQAYSAAHDLALSAAMSQVPGEARVIRLSEEVSDESLEPRAVDVRIVVETLEEIGVPQARKSASLPAG